LSRCVVSGPTGGARKLAVLFGREGLELPVITVHPVLVRHDLMLDQESRRQATGQFEREYPNQLWQMDFKGQNGTGLPSARCPCWTTTAAIWLRWNRPARRAAKRFASGLRMPSARAGCQMCC
jgi:hypothetical protein